jgi:hypothetical protein
MRECGWGYLASQDPSAVPAGERAFVDTFEVSVTTICSYFMRGFVLYVCLKVL